MKTLVIGIVSIIVVALIAIGLFSSHPMPPASNATVGATSTLATSTNTYTIHITYPHFGIEKADAQVKAIIDKAVGDLEAMPPNPTPVDARNELDGEYQMINPGPEIVSAKMELYQYTGGAHGLTTPYGLNFHADGEPVTLKEALALIGKNLDQVSTEAKRQLNTQFSMVQFPEGAAPTEANYSTFVVGTSTVTFIFQQYQVEAYAAGMPEVTFARVK